MKLSAQCARLTLLFTLLVMSSNAVRAQSTSARVVGTVTDVQGGAVPRVTVTITNSETNFVRTANTDDEGNYNLTNIPIGVYQVSAELTGFKRAVLPQVQLVVDQTARVDLRLETGEVSEQVTVQAETPLVDSETSTVGQVIGNQTIVQLPLNGRNFIRLGSLIPGATEGAPGNTIVRDRQGGVALTVNGQRAEYNNYTLDGVDNNETLFGVAVVVPSIDAIQEFKVQTANYSAEFGRGSGANVNVAIKSGTNELHGTVYEFLRNDVFDARNPFSPVKNPLRRNQFGFSVGGPVVLPRFGEGGEGGRAVINGRDRTFFFANYEGLRERRSFTGFYNVPTLAQRAGTFGTTRINDPATGAQFPGNQIPTARLSPISQRFLALIPQPNTTDPRGNYTQQFSNPIDNNQINFRGDHRVTQNDQLFVRYSQTDSESTPRSINFGSTTTTIETKGGVIGYTRIISSKIVNDLRFGAQRYAFSQLPEGYGTNGAAAVGLPTFATDASYFRYPSLSITGFTGFGGNAAIPLIRGENTFQLVDNLSLSLGKHTVRIGGDLRFYQASNFQPQFTAGEYFFTGPRTGGNLIAANALADFLLGVPTQQRILNPTGFDKTRLRNTRLNLYLQDDFQVSQKLTLNLGLRYELDGAWREAGDRFAYFDFALGQVVYPQDAQTPFRTFPYPSRFDDVDAIRPARNRQFAPRVGFAYRPFADGTTVLRAAYGVFWGQPIANIFLNTAFTPPPFSLQQNLTGNALQFGVFPGTGASSLIPTNPSFFTISPDDFTNSYVQQWNVGVERQVAFNIALKASYVGSKGTHLERRYDGNYGLPSTVAITNARRRFANFAAIQLQESTARSSYHSAQFSAEKRFSRGFLFLAGYTYAKSIDDTSSWTGLGGQEAPFPQNPLNLSAEKGRSAFDLRHRFTLSTVYELPFRSENRAVDALIGGFQLSGILTLRDGYPFTIQIPGDIANVTGAATAFQRPNLVGEPFAGVPAGLYFNPAAFSRPAPGTFGNLGRNTVEGRSAQQLDFSVLKVFRFSERQSLQFRAEAFNVLNHPTFGLPVSSFTDVNFGRIVGADNRELQFGLKYIF